MIVPLVLSELFARCAPNVGAVTMAAIVAYESGGSPFAIGDNTVRRSYFPSGKKEAVLIANRLLRERHNLDLGYAQINSGNFAAYDLSVPAALDPCTNLRTGSLILQADYVGAVRTYGSGQAALRHALSAYNSGGYWAGWRYAGSVYAEAARLRYQPPHTALRLFVDTRAR